MQEGPDGYCQAERQASDGSPAAATPPKPRAGPAADNWEEVHAGNKAREIAVNHMQKSWDLGENS